MVVNITGMWFYKLALLYNTYKMRHCTSYILSKLCMELYLQPGIIPNIKFLVHTYKTNIWINHHHGLLQHQFKYTQCECTLQPNLTIFCTYCTYSAYCLVCAVLAVCIVQIMDDALCLLCAGITAMKEIQTFGSLLCQCYKRKEPTLWIQNIWNRQQEYLNFKE